MSRKLDNIQRKKEELQKSLNEIQGNLDRSLDEVKGDMSDTLSPKAMVKKYPLHVLGASVIVGFLIGSGGKKERAKNSRSENLVVESIGQSLKKRLTKKAVEIALDFFEDQLQGKRNHQEK